MTVLNLLLDRMNSIWTDPESGHLEDIATFSLVVLLALVTLIAIL